MIRVVTLLALLLAPLPALAEQVVGALSQNRVSITADFDGSEVFLFGAVKRFAPVDDAQGPLGVVIILKGPTQRVSVRRKERTFGIWVNRDSVEVDEAPSFYTIATTGPLDEIMSATEQQRYSIGYPHVVRLVGAPAHIAAPETFTQAVVRIHEDNGTYALRDGIVDLAEETLFSTRIALPANLVEGDYQVRMFLVRDRAVISFSESAIAVQKVGLERWIYNLAHERPLIYGLMSIAIALAAGWGASEAFRLLRR